MSTSMGTADLDPRNPRNLSGSASLADRHHACSHAAVRPGAWSARPGCASPTSPSCSCCSRWASISWSASPACSISAYIAFYAVGAYVYALLASPHFGLHLPWWMILPIGAFVACVFGILLGAPTLKLRGDYLAIVTLGFGEIVRIFMNNLSEPINVTNGPKGISPPSTRSRCSGLDFGNSTRIGDYRAHGHDQILLLPVGGHC